MGGAVPGSKSDNRKEILTARVNPLWGWNAPRFMMGHVTVSGNLTDFTFSGDTTNYVSGPICLYGLPEASGFSNDSQ